MLNWIYNSKTEKYEVPNDHFIKIAADRIEDTSKPLTEEEKTIISYLVLNLILKPKYEFYDLDGNPGISTNCKIVEEGLVCEVKNQFVPVGQYSKIE